MLPEYCYFGNTLAGVFYVIVYILGIDERESNGSDGATEQKSHTTSE